MNDIKLSLSIVLPGRVMFSKEECLKTTQKVIEKKGKNGKIHKKTIEVQVEDWDKMDLHKVMVSDDMGNLEILSCHTRKCYPATQSLNITREAYLYMVSKECPSWAKPAKWNAMSKKERLEAHLQKTMEHLGGISYTYQIFED